jgi:hypothetical protein
MRVMPAEVCPTRRRSSEGERRKSGGDVRSIPIVVNSA